MILCGGIDMRCVCVCVYVCVREKESRYMTQRIRKVKYINKGERLNMLQSGRRVLYIVTLSLH